MSSDDDGIGTALRIADPGHHYLCAVKAQRAFRIYARNHGAPYTVPAQNSKGFIRSRWRAVGIVLRGSQTQASADGAHDSEVTDVTLARGAFALYSWCSAGSKYRALRWHPAG